MHRLTTSETDLFRQVAAKYATDQLLWGLADEDGLPLVFDGYGYNRTYIDDALEPQSGDFQVAMFLAWYDWTRPHEPGAEDAFRDLCSHYLADRVVPEACYERFEPIFLDEGRYPDFISFVRYVDEHYLVPDPLMTYMHAITLEDSSLLLEAMCHLDGHAFDHLRDGLRLSYLETDFASHDPVEESVPGFRHESVETVLRAQTALLETWRTKGTYDEDFYANLPFLRLINPYKGGGFSCMN